MPEVNRKNSPSDNAAEIDRVRNLEANWAETEQVLTRTIIRLTLATSGKDPDLDPALKRIRENVRHGITGSTGVQKLDKLSESLIHNDSEPTEVAQPQGNDLLFQLLDLMPLPKDKSKRVAELRKELVKADSARGADIMVALAKIYASHSSGEEEKGGLFKRLFKATDKNNSDEAQTDRATDEARERLCSVIEEMILPDAMLAKADTLVEQVQEESLNTAWSSVLDGTVELVSSMQDQIKQERREIQQFLSSITDGLSMLDQDLGEIQQTGRSSFKAGDEMDRVMSSEMAKMASGMEGASDLEQMKAEVVQRLASMQKSMEENRNKQETLKTESESQVQALSGRLNALEGESCELRQNMNKLQDRALRDALTAVPNRLAYDERIMQEFGRWKRFDEPMTLMVWDVDLFKQINDTYGHTAGDRVLKSVASALSSCLRETDFVARYGGEEFVVLLPGTLSDDALIVCEKIREKVATTAFRSGDDQVKVTISCGYSHWLDSDGPEDLFDRADKALYKAKKAGRNCCMKA